MTIKSVSTRTGNSVLAVTLGQIGVSVSAADVAMWLGCLVLFLIAVYYFICIFQAINKKACEYMLQVDCNRQMNELRKEIEDKWTAQEKWRDEMRAMMERLDKRIQGVYDVLIALPKGHR